MSGGSYDYLYCKDCDELFAYSNIRTLEEMESRFLDLGYEDVAKDFRRLIEYIKSANNRVEVLGGQLNEMMHDIEWYDSGDIGADTLAERVEKYRRADTPQNERSEFVKVSDRECPWCKAVCASTDKYCHECGWHIADTPQTEMDKCYKCKWWNYSYGCSNKKGICDFEQVDTPQTEETCERCVYVRGSQWCQGCNGTPKRWDGEKIVDATQNERSE